MWAYYIGNHQKINKVARKKLATLSGLKHFPSNRSLRYFEGKRGPDSIKLKNTGVDKPHAFYDPFDPEDDDLLKSVRQHYKSLVKYLKEQNSERAAFEASWLAHTLVDGLTPAHHYPYEEEMEKLSNRSREDQMLKDKMRIKGDTTKETVKKNWQVWGVKGLLSTHMAFEGGVAAICIPLSFKDLEVSKDEVLHAKEVGLEEYFKANARDVAMLHIYEDFYRFGWNTGLARTVRDQLMPIIIKTVTIAWYLALSEAGMTTRHKDENN